MSMVTYPLNNIEYTAEDAELFHSTRTSGVYATNSFDYSLAGLDNTVVIGTGIAWIKNGEFSGKVVAQKESLNLNMGLSDPNYPRIDAVVIQFDANKNASEIVVKKGTASSMPTAPSVVRNESVYELHLYHVRREAGELTVSANSVTDLRQNNNYCGLMYDSVTQAVDKTLTLSGVAADAKAVGDLINSVEKKSVPSTRTVNRKSLSSNIELTASDVGAAPIGFGLGLTTPTSITTAEELHNTRKCGFYRYNISDSVICGVRFSNASLIVYSITTNGCVQELRPFNSNYCLRRYYSGTTWTDWELVGGVQELVWENASRTSSFKKQSNVREMPVYDEYLAYCCLNGGEQNDWIIAARCPVGETLAFNFVWADDGIKYHRAIKTRQDGFDFEDGYRQEVVDEKACIPYQIYGIKGVSK